MIERTLRTVLMISRTLRAAYYNDDIFLMKIPKGTEGGAVYSHFLLLHWSETFVELNQDNTNSATI
jgi:hypothetical protein